MSLFDTIRQLTRSIFPYVSSHEESGSIAIITEIISIVFIIAFIPRKVFTFYRWIRKYTVKGGLCHQPATLYTKTAQIPFKNTMWQMFLIGWF